MLKILRNLPPKLLEAIKEFRKSAEYKVNIKKSILFLFPSNE